jgi:CheY-like chemotaxis protein
MAFEDLAEVEKLQPQLIVLDFVLQSRQTSWIFLQKLRLHRPTKDIPVLICTAAFSDIKELVNDVRSEQVLPSDVSTCPPI